MNSFPILLGLLFDLIRNLDYVTHFIEVQFFKILPTFMHK